MAFPSTLDELTDGVPSDGAAPTTALDNATYPHDDHHRALAVAVEAVETELGTDPSGSEATVKARIAAVETLADAAQTAAEVATAVATHAGLSDPHPGYTTAAELAAYAQPLDSDLTAIAALSTTAYGRAFLALADQAALVALLPSYQPLDSDLTSLAALTTTAYGRAVLELANQAALMALLSTASTSAEGKIEVATLAEAKAGTDTARAVTPEGVLGAIATRLVNTQTGTSYTLVAGDAGKLVTMSNGSASSLTIPANASVAFDVGTQIEVIQLGAGQVTVGITSDTLRSTETGKLTDQYSGVVLTKIATTEWIVLGRVTS